MCWTMRALRSCNQIRDGEIDAAQAEQFRQFSPQSPIVVCGQRDAAPLQLAKPANRRERVWLHTFDQAQIGDRALCLEKRAVLSNPERLHKSSRQYADDRL